MDGPRRGPTRILIVEDNPANLLLTRAVLQRAGYHTSEAHSAEAALDLVYSALPDVILMDVQLPGQDGLALTKRLKSDPATASIPIVVLTAHAMSTDRVRAEAAGCDGYISKPINTRTLADEVARVIRRSAVAKPEQPA